MAHVLASQTTLGPAGSQGSRCGMASNDSSCVRRPGLGRSKTAEGRMGGRVEEPRAGEEAGSRTLEGTSMAAHCALCKRGSDTPAYVACSNCGQFACDAHHWVWRHGRAAFCQECWYDGAGKSLLSLTDALIQADKGGDSYPSSTPDRPSRDRPVPPAFRQLAGLIREDRVCRNSLRGSEDPLVELASVLRRVAELLDQISRGAA